MCILLLINVIAVTTTTATPSVGENGHRKNLARTARLGQGLEGVTCVSHFTQTHNWNYDRPEDVTLGSGLDSIQPSMNRYGTPHTGNGLIGGGFYYLVMSQGM